MANFGAKDDWRVEKKGLQGRRELTAWIERSFLDNVIVELRLATEALITPSGRLERENERNQTATSS